MAAGLGFAASAELSLASPSAHRVPAVCALLVSRLCISSHLDIERRTPTQSADQQRDPRYRCGRRDRVRAEVAVRFQD